MCPQISEVLNQKENESPTNILLSLVDSMVWGETGSEGNPLHVNPKAVAEQVLQGKTNRIKILGEYDLTNHFNANRTLHFCSNPDGPAGLLLLDIDCHKQGTYRDAECFARWIADNVFTGLFYEPSTHGNGVHGYIIVLHEGDAKRLVRLARTLEILLNKIENGEFGIEMVEVKGTPRRWVGQTVSQRLRYGLLGKMPRTLPDRLEEFRNTWNGSLDNLEQIIEHQAAHWEIDLSRNMHHPKREGSVSGNLISDHDLEQIQQKGFWQAMADFLMKRLDWKEEL